MEENHICDVCHKHVATEFLKFKVNNKSVERWLCPQCAKKINLGDGFFDDFFPGSILGSILMGTPSRIPEAQTRKAAVRRCPVCGSTEEEIMSDYKFGCSECYNVFYDLARSYVAKLGGSGYKGRGPESKMTEEQRREQQPEEGKSLADRIEEMRAKMHAASDRGDYETAAKIKRQINNLTGGGDE